MIRLDDNREADETLVTHAEYQLFLDDMRAQGKFYQPDHWQSYQFPAGQGRQPVLGVRPSDAVAFCEWLTNRMGDGWRYRIPDAAELPPLADKSGARSDVGYWVTSNDAWSLEGREALSLDDRASNYLGGAWDRARDRALDRAHARDRDRDRTLARARDLVLARAFDLARARDLVLARARALDLVRDRDLARARDHDLARDRDRALDRALALDRDRDQDVYLDIFSNIVILQGRQEGQLPVFEGIRIVRERISHEGSDTGA